jgi:two-component system response regulator AtoC
VVWDIPATLREEDLRPSPVVARRLVVIGGGRVDSRALVDRTRLTIGRGDDCDVQLDDPAVSRVHAVLHVADVLEVEDLGSANGTRVRGVRLAPRQLTAIELGEVFDVGGTLLVVQAVDARTTPRRVRPHTHLEARVEDECQRRARARRRPFAIIRVRVDGDFDREALERSLSEPLGEDELLATWGPAEYALLFLEATPERGSAVMVGLRDALVSVGVRANLGLATYPVDGLSADALLEAASTTRGESSAPDAVLEAPAMRDLHRLLERVAVGMISVLLLGETGVGKEIFAELVHRLSPRREAPFVRLNCAALSEGLIESELFGHERGAFTGAVAAKPGLLESADGGTVFLDEVGELPPAIQVKLLRVLEERRVTRVGALKPRDIDVRVVAATHRDLHAEMEAARFREDLYFRLAGITLEIPPLRERGGDVAALAAHFLGEGARRAGRSSPPPLSPAALALLRQHDWPGNLRELRNAMERAVLLAGEVVDVEHLPLDKLEASRWRQTAPPASAEDLAELPADERAARERIVQALERCAGNQTRAAELLGVSRQTLNKWLARHRLPRPRKPEAQ